MARPKFNLPTLQSLADSGAYGGIRILSADSSILMLSTGVWLSELDNWRGAGYQLTQAEIDTIEEIVATLESDTMTDAEDEVSDIVLIKEIVLSSDASSVTLEDFGDYPYKRFDFELSGLLSNFDHSEDALIMRINDDSTVANYVSLSNIVRSVGASYVHRTDVSALIFFGAVGAIEDDLHGVGALMGSIFRPRSDADKRMRAYGGVIGNSPLRSFLCDVSGWYKSASVISKITVFPNQGTTFLVGGVDEPKYLRAALYGVK